MPVVTGRPRFFVLTPIDAMDFGLTRKRPGRKYPANPPGLTIPANRHTSDGYRTSCHILPIVPHPAAHSSPPPPRPSRRPWRPFPPSRQFSAGAHPDAALVDLCDQVRATVSEIEDTPARTLVGLAAKARVFIADAAGSAIQPDEGLLKSLLADIAALAEEASTGLAV